MKYIVGTVGLCPTISRDASHDAEVKNFAFCSSNTKLHYTHHPLYYAVLHQLLLFLLSAFLEKPTYLQSAMALTMVDWRDVSDGIFVWAAVQSRFDATLDKLSRSHSR